MFDYTNYKDFSDYAIERVEYLNSSHAKTNNCDLIIFDTPDEILEEYEEYPYAAEYSNSEDSKLYLFQNIKESLDLSNCYGTLYKDNDELYNYTTDFMKQEAEVFVTNNISVDDLYFIKCLDNYLSANGSLKLDLNDKKESKLAKIILDKQFDPDNKWDSKTNKDGDVLTVYNIETDNLVNIVDDLKKYRDIIEPQMTSYVEPIHLSVRLFLDDLKYEDILKTFNFNDFEA